MQFRRSSSNTFYEKNILKFINADLFFIGQQALQRAIKY
jgi:hypothetical protein